MFSQDRNALRNVYILAWNKAKTDQSLEPLEQQVVEVARRHPEYHALLEAGDSVLDRDWLPEQGESNPFLHMGLHIALLEQVATDRPPGIRKLYQQTINRCLGNTHEAEHLIMECIAEAMWKMQRNGGDANPKALLKCIKKRAGGAGQDW